MNRATNAPILDLPPTTVCRGDRTLIRGLSIRLLPGEVLHLQGENGSGKTSLLEVVAGLRPAAEGGLADDSRPAMHYLGHRNGLTGALTARENLLDSAALLGAPASAVDPALERVGMSRRRHRRASQLSAGQARRTALARLLLVERRLWLLDEPYASLDSAGITMLDGLIRAHTDAGGAVLISSHQALGDTLGQVRHQAVAA